MPVVKETTKNMHCFGIRSLHMRGPLLALLIISVFLLSAGCAPGWEPSDIEAVGLVKSYFLYTHKGKSVDAEITVRGKYDRDCKCFPIEFKMTESEKGTYKKTFYFFRNQTGNVEVREYMDDAGVR